jgi:hypothetical protein
MQRDAQLRASAGKKSMSASFPKIQHPLKFNFKLILNTSKIRKSDQQLVPERPYVSAAI